MLKAIKVILTPFFILAFSLNSYSQSNKIESKQFPVLRGDYIGQNPPGNTPELFAPGIISTGMGEYSSIFSPDGNEFYFDVPNPSHSKFYILGMKRINGLWSPPELVSFSGKYYDSFPFVSPDNKKMFFTSRRPVYSGDLSFDWNIWVSLRTEKGWSEPYPLPPPINTDTREYAPSLDSNGTLYFTSNRKGGKGRTDIYRCFYEDGAFTLPENLGENVNTENGEFNSCIAPDGSYLIFISNRQQGSFGNNDFYVSFRKSDGNFAPAVNLGESVNTPGWENRPAISYDGKYLFYSTYRYPPDMKNQEIKSYDDLEIQLEKPQNGEGDIYWVSTGIIHNLKTEIKENADKVKKEAETESYDNGAILFAPGIISKGYDEYGISFSPDGKECFFTIEGVGKTVILYSRKKDDVWQKPRIAPFSGLYSDQSPCFSPDGNWLYFCSDRPGRDLDEPQDNFDIWRIDRISGGWTEPVKLDEPVNSRSDETSVSSTKDGTIYFSSGRNGGEGGMDLYMSKPVNGKYTIPEKLENNINTSFNEIHPCFAPDGSFLIFSSDRSGGYRLTDRNAGYGREHDLYICFRKSDGAWTEPQNMGPGINSGYNEYYPYFFSGENCLYFTSDRESDKFFNGTIKSYKELVITLKNPGAGSLDIYRVDAGIFDDLKQKELK